jgi:hypothetical protein
VRRLEDELEAFDKQGQPALDEREREHLMRLGADLEIAWSHPAATTATRKRIVRAVLHEIVVRVENDRIAMVLHWQGGDHTPLQVKKNATGKSRWTVEEDVEVLVRVLARMMPDQSIAAVLNRAGKLTGRQNGWTQGKVCSLRKRLAVAVYQGRRTRRERRAHFVRNCGDAQYQPDDRAANDPQWRASCATALQRHALGD